MGSSVAPDCASEKFEVLEADRTLRESQDCVLASSCEIACRQCPPCPDAMLICESFRSRQLRCFWDTSYAAAPPSFPHRPAGAIALPGASNMSHRTVMLPVLEEGFSQIGKLPSLRDTKEQIQILCRGILFAI